ncbi:zinc finger and BTB domain-containing protein 22-like isoform X1 [Sinocyclocheilus anshuiensis]|uniref:zinc finger and BTB domain-containing protein 22-like isoform X1 n=2 Tax=Sinocyclocheilus anshuiensis TaxID=1608454 RepID=UPI0007B891D8|nr:PREDICTED: zinc finger and BTB domain-containing protein 22-like isoform X1 [Sinocyclocheilus anshuiensis]
MSYTVYYTRSGSPGRGRVSRSVPQTELHSERRMEQLVGRSAPPGPVLQVCFPSARASVLENLNRQREEGQLCDLSIQVQGQVFRAHRCVLAASSPYFHDQVLLKNVTTVSLPSVMDPLAFESVLNSAYTGQLSIVRDDIINYGTVAIFLQMWNIVNKCTDILKRSRPLVQVSPGGATSSSHQSPSSSDCCFADPEDGERAASEQTLEKCPQSALPPLATWRRPTQSRWSRSSLTFPVRTEPECGPNTGDEGFHAFPVAPLPSIETSDFARHRIRARLRGAKEDEEQRRMEADEGVGEPLDEDKVRVKCEEHQAGAVESDGRLRESESGETDELWNQWTLSDAKFLDEDEEDETDVAFETYDEIEKATGQISQRPLPPPTSNQLAPGTSELSWVSQSSSSSPCSPLSATPKVHFCHCGKAYTLKSMRDRHVKMQHLNLRPFACPVCSKSFKMKHHLTKHVKTHGGLRPYECALCGKKIVWRDSFLKHQARCQGTTTTSGRQNDDADAPGQVKVEQHDYSLQDEEIHS